MYKGMGVLDTLMRERSDLGIKSFRELEAEHILSMFSDRDKEVRAGKAIEHIRKIEDFEGKNNIAAEDIIREIIVITERVGN